MEATIADEVIEAIESGVEDGDQPKNVADKLVGWMNDVASGRESMGDEESVRRRLDVLFESLEVEDLKESVK